MAKGSDWLSETYPNTFAVRGRANVLAVYIESCLCVTYPFLVRCSQAYWVLLQIPLGSMHFNTLAFRLARRAYRSLFFESQMRGSMRPDALSAYR